MFLVDQTYFIIYVVEQMASQTWGVQNGTLITPIPGPHSFFPIVAVIQNKNLEVIFGSYLSFTRDPTFTPNI